MPAYRDSLSSFSQQENMTSYTVVPSEYNAGLPLKMAAQYVDARNAHQYADK
jgi:hypothetical protein